MKFLRREVTITTRETMKCQLNIYIVLYSSKELHKPIFVFKKHSFFLEESINHLVYYREDF